MEVGSGGDQGQHIEVSAISGHGRCRGGGRDSSGDFDRPESVVHRASGELARCPRTRPASRSLQKIVGAIDQGASAAPLQKIVGAIVGAARTGHLRGSSPPRVHQLDKIFDQALILWCGMVTCGRAEIPVLGRDMGALGFKFPTTHRAYGGAGSELRRAEGGMVRSSEGTQRRSFSSLG